MVNLPAARRHHRSRVSYAFGLLALIGAVVTLVVVARYPAESATRLAEPVPAPEITVVERGAAPTDDPDGTQLDRALPGPDRDATPEDHGAAGYPDTGRSGREATTDSHGTAGDPNTGQAGVGGGASAFAGPRHPAGDPRAVARSLFYSGLLGLAISLAGLGLVGTRRRMW